MLKKIINAIFTPKYNIRNMIISLILGFVMSFLLITVVFSPEDAIKMFKDLFFANFHNSTGGSAGITFLLNKFIVLGFVGLSVLVGLKSKILNIGISGQMTMGALLAYLFSNKYSNGETSTFFIAFIICILVSISLSVSMGMLKIFFKVNEVVSFIMLNWIVVFIVKACQTSVSIPTVHLDMAVSLFKGNSHHLWMYCIIGIFMFFISIIGTWLLFKYSTIGFKAIANGSNPTAGFYAGYKSKQFQIIIFALSGLFAGLAGFVFYFFNKVNISTAIFPEPIGFMGIAIALIAMLSPLFIVFVSLGFAILSGPINGISVSYNERIFEIFSGIIIYFVAIVGLWSYFRPIFLFKSFKSSWKKERIRKYNSKISKEVK
ncbi:MAG: hypothetical protein K4H23_05525 [Mollicutes bacterium PWAP]|nr:hypothetical protein [Mollicutes bacterium PWAP]